MLKMQNNCQNLEKYGLKYMSASAFESRIQQMEWEDFMSDVFTIKPLKIYHKIKEFVRHISDIDNSAIL